ncbi:MAG: hypothetical protein RR620_12115 [Clostridium sp.]
MNNELKILGLKEIESKEQVKKAYYKKVKEYPPEIYSEEFILLNEAYNNVINYIENNKLYEIQDEKDRVNINKIISALKKSIYDNEYFLLPKMITDLFNILTLSNFQYINNEVIDMIIELMKYGFESEALYIAYVFEKKFKDIELIDLSKAYRRLEKHIVMNS